MTVPTRAAIMSPLGRSTIWRGSGCACQQRETAGVEVVRTATGTDMWFGVKELRPPRPANSSQPNVKVSVRS